MQNLRSLHRQSSNYPPDTLTKFHILLETVPRISPKPLPRSPDLQSAHQPETDVQNCNGAVLGIINLPGQYRDYPGMISH